MKLSTQGNGSIRTLNSKQLVVDWMGHHNLFYRMTRKQFRDALKGGWALVKHKLHDASPQTVSFVLTIHPSGAMNIGCEFFTREDVRKMKRWAKGEGKKIRKWVEEVD
jgi:hypothetical protein